MRVRPAEAAEVLHATIIEDSPEEEYGNHRFDDTFGLEYDHQSYPTAYWNSRYYSFLQVNTDVALEGLIALVEFCTDRWDGERSRFRRSSAGITIALSDGSTRHFRGDHAVFDWAQENSTNAGQLHSALAALEKWLCDQIESGVDVAPYLTRLLRQTSSVAFLGVLVNIGKFRPDLFEGPLRHLLANRELYEWDKYRCEAQQIGFDAGAWARQGETVFQMARQWCLAGYRSRSLRDLASSLVAWKLGIAEFLAIETRKWEVPKNPKDALEHRLLLADLDRRTYKEVRHPDGNVGMRREYPEDLQREVADYESSTAPALQALVLPSRCREFLPSEAALSSQSAESLASVLKPEFVPAEASLDKDQRRLARIAAASTLIARGDAWLEENPDAKKSAEEIVRDCINQIDDGYGFLRDRALRPRDGDLTFCAYASMQRLFHAQPRSKEIETTVLRLLTSGDESALRIIMSLSYKHRATHPRLWKKLLQLSLLWSGLVVLAPRSDEPEVLKQLWTRWLQWLRRRDLCDQGATHAIDPLSLARRVERLQRRRWTREFARARKGFGGDPRRRRSAGLDRHFLLRTYAWLFEQMQDTTSVLADEWPERLQELKQLLAFELAPHEQRADEDRDEPPTAIGYELMPALASAIVRLSPEQGREVWKPILALGGRAHYIVENFVDNWFRQVSSARNMELVAPHWRGMIEYALTSAERGLGRRWFYGERILCRLLGCGSEPLLDQNVDVSTVVEGMKDLFASWAERHLPRDEDHFTYLCGFLASKSGERLRLEGIGWLDRALQGEGRDSWRRSQTGASMVDFLDVVLSQGTDKLLRQIAVRDAYLRLVAVLVKRQVPSALALQERARTILSAVRG